MKDLLVTLPSASRQNQTQSRNNGLRIEEVARTAADKMDELVTLTDVGKELLMTKVTKIDQVLR